VGADAAAALRAELREDGIPVIVRSVSARASARELAGLAAALEPGDIPVLWLRKQDIAALGEPPAGVPLAYMSGRMGGLEQAPLPPAWRPLTHMAYPFDLPEHRRVQVDYPLGWFRMEKIPVVAEQVQADTYLACAILSEAINHMVDTFVRDYLVERVEESLEHRIVTGYYPRLALAPGQRFASKGGYVVHFAGESGTRVIADGGWITP
jgi:hypothetical protein